MMYLSKPGTQPTRIIEPVLTQSILIPNAQHTDDWSRPDTKGTHLRPYEALLEIVLIGARLSMCFPFYSLCGFLLQP